MELSTLIGTMEIGKILVFFPTGTDNTAYLTDVEMFDDSELATRVSELCSCYLRSYRLRS